MRLLLLNGPNLNLLGQRETAIYGGIPFDVYLEKLRSKYPSITIDYQQCNIEGALVEAIQNAQLIYDGIILNAGAYTHTSIAIADAIRVFHWVWLLTICEMLKREYPNGVHGLLEREIHLRPAWLR
jgi:3-dehydroquinate dehydratase